MFRYARVSRTSTSRRTVDALGTLIIPELRAYEAGRPPSDSGK